eukprot:scaffold1770_cov375-Prasinococcus_capsulatus_cf.AAC.4
MAASPPVKRRRVSVGALHAEEIERYGKKGTTGTSGACATHGETLDALQQPDWLEEQVLSTLEHCGCLRGVRGDNENGLSCWSLVAGLPIAAVRDKLQRNLQANSHLRDAFVRMVEELISRPESLADALAVLRGEPFHTRNECFCKLLLATGCIQAEVARRLLEALAEQAVQEHQQGAVGSASDVSAMILSCFHDLDVIVAGDTIVSGLLEILQNDPKGSLRKRILHILPGLVREEDLGGDDGVVYQILALFDDSDTVVSAIQAMSNLNLKNLCKDEFEEVMAIMARKLESVEVGLLPTLIEVIMEQSTPDCAHFVVAQLRAHLKLTDVCTDAGSSQLQLRLMSTLRSGFHLQPSLRDAYLKHMAEMSEPGQIGPLDMWLILAMQATHKGLGQRQLEAKLCEGIFTIVTAKQALKVHKEVLWEYFESLKSCLSHMLSHKDLCCRKFGASLYAGLFKLVDSPRYQQDIIAGLVEHLGSDRQDSERDASLYSISILAKRHRLIAIQFYPFFEHLLNFLPTFSHGQCRKLFVTFARLAAGPLEDSLNPGQHVHDSLMKFIKKKLYVEDEGISQYGVCAGVCLVLSLGKVEGSSQSLQKAKGLLQMMLEACRRSHRLAGQIYTEMSDCVLEGINRGLCRWLLDEVTAEFQACYIQNISRVDKDMLWFEIPGNSPAVALRIGQLATRSLQDNALRSLAAHVRLLKELSIVCDNDLSQIEGILTTPVELFALSSVFVENEDHVAQLHPSLSPSKTMAVLNSFLVMEAYLREAIGAFTCTIVDASAATERRPSVLEKHLLVRLRDLVHVSLLLKQVEASSQVVAQFPADRGLQSQQHGLKPGSLGTRRKGAVDRVRNTGKQRGFQPLQPCLLKLLSLAHVESSGQPSMPLMAYIVDDLSSSYVYYCGKLQAPDLEDRKFILEMIKQLQASSRALRVVVDQTRRFLKTPGSRDALERRSYSLEDVSLMKNSELLVESESSAITIFESLIRFVALTLKLSGDEEIDKADIDRLLLHFAGGPGASYPCTDTCGRALEYFAGLVDVSLTLGTEHRKHMFFDVLVRLHVLANTETKDVQRLQQLDTIIQRTAGQMLRHIWDEGLRDRDLRNLLDKYLGLLDDPVATVQSWGEEMFPRLLEGERDEADFRHTLSLKTFPTWYKAAHRAARQRYTKECNVVKTLGRTHPEALEALRRAHDAVKSIVTLTDMASIIDSQSCRSRWMNIMLKDIVEQNHMFVKLSLKQQDIIKQHAERKVLVQFFNDSSKVTKKMQSIIDQLKERDDKGLNPFRRKIPTIKRDIERHTNEIPRAFRKYGQEGASVHVGQLKHKNCVGEVVLSQVPPHPDFGYDTEGPGKETLDEISEDGEEEEYHQGPLYEETTVRGTLTHGTDIRGRLGVCEVSQSEDDDDSDEGAEDG